MAPDIIVGEDLSKGPKARCPHCEKPLTLMLDAFKPDITKIVRSLCPYCSKEIYAGLMILVHPNLNGLLEALKQVIAITNPKNLNLVRNPNKPDIKIVKP